jgi:uncharacterized repeat protein (TIGR03809 family)
MGVPEIPMAAQQSSPYDAVARGWLALAERRRAHLIELFETGRWRHYFTETELLGELRAVNLARERFARVVGLEPAAAVWSA